MAPLGRCRPDVVRRGLRASAWLARRDFARQMSRAPRGARRTRQEDRPRATAGSRGLGLGAWPLAGVACLTAVGLVLIGCGASSRHQSTSSSGVKVAHTALPPQPSNLPVPSSAVATSVSNSVASSTLPTPVLARLRCSRSKGHVRCARHTAKRHGHYTAEVGGATIEVGGALFSQCRHAVFMSAAEWPGFGGYAGGVYATPFVFDEATHRWSNFKGWASLDNPDFIWTVSPVYNPTRAGVILARKDASGWHKVWSDAELEEGGC
jgi:hypothetical protein